MSHTKLLQLLEHQYRAAMEASKRFTPEQIDESWKRYREQNGLDQETTPTAYPSTDQFELVLIPCAENDPRAVGGYTSYDGQSLCHVREGHAPILPTTTGDSLPADIIDKLLKIRDAMAKNDFNEAHHWLYSIASPHFDKLEPWAEMESKRAAHPKEDAAGSGKEEVVAFMNWTLQSECKYSCTDEDQWTNINDPLDSITTSELYNIFKQPK